MTATLPAGPGPFDLGPLDPTPPAGPGLPRRRRGWLVVGLAVAALAIAVGVWDLVGAVSRQPVHYQRTWSGAVHALDLDVGNGSVTLVGTNRPGAVVQADGARGLTSPTNDQTLADGTLRIRSTCPFTLGSAWCSLSYRVEVPAGTSVVALAHNGRVTTSGLRGTLQLTADNGRITANSPSGTLAAHARNGTVQVTGATSAQVTASTDNGSVRVGFADPPQSVNASSRNGSVTVGIPRADLAYRVTVHSRNGHVSTPVRTDPLGTRTITATSDNGDVTVRYGAA